MAKDLGDVIGNALGKSARKAADNFSSGGALSGMKGVAAGAGLATVAPLAAWGAGKLVGRGVARPAKKAGEQVKGAAGKQVKNASSAAGRAAKAGKGLVPGVGGNGDGGADKNEATGVGKGRRMPIQQSVDVAVPVRTAYNEWTQFEEWPNFMHRLENVSQEDDAHVRFKAKIWGISKEFMAEIVEQRPDERIKWSVTEGITHNGVVSFHELAPRLTRIELNVDIEPGSLLEKAARGMRHVKRAIRADLHRFKAYVEMEEDATGKWRGTIEDGEVKRRSSSGGRSRARAKSSSSRSRGSTGGATKASSSSSQSRASRGGASKAKSSSSRSGSSGAKSSRGRSRSTSGSRSSSNGSRASSSGSRSSSSRKQAGSRS